MTTTTVKLPPGISAQLAAESRTRRVTKSQIIRESLEKHFKTGGKRRRLTFGDVAGDLAGSLDSGVTDLSTNPKYMDGFGA